MPAETEKQRKFFGFVRAIQKGEAHGSAKAEKAAREVSPADVKKFAHSSKHKKSSEGGY